MDTIRLCRECQAPLPPDSPGSACAECGRNPDHAGFADLEAEPLTPPTPAELASVFPGMEITEVIGSGGMGTVYKARQPQLDRVVALKILSPWLGRDSAFADRFSREAQALAKLNHSNIVSIFDFGQAGGFFYFLMEYVDGVSLWTLIQQKSFNAEEAQRVVIEICHALQYAHDEGIVHRDIKPSNILIDRKGRVKIADFGLAGLKGEKALAQEQRMVVMGTPHYMAPEQLDQPWKVDLRADIYALGVMFGEMLSGEIPGAMGPPTREVAGTDPRLLDIVSKAAAKTPRKRFQNANEMRAAVEIVTGRFHNLPGDLPRGQPGRKWSWLPRFALAAGTIWLAVVTVILLKDHWAEQNSVVIPAGALEAFAAGPEGLGLGHRMAVELSLADDQLQFVNRILRRYQREFTALERRNTERSKNAAGHIVVAIKPFPREMDDLMNRMWAELATGLSATQVSKAKSMHFERFFPHTGRKPVSVEIWQEENGEFRYVEGREAVGTNRGPGGAMPSRYRNWLFHENSKTNK